MKTLVFKATDTLFFRESRPMEAQGELQSVFPPPVRTLAGAVRTLIGNHMCVDWNKFSDKPTDPTCQNLRKIIGFSEDLGELSFQGAWLMHENQRLFPSPLHLMKKDSAEAFTKLCLDKETACCDLGKKVRLAKLEDKDRGAKALDNTWLSQAAMQAVLNGELPKFADLKPEKDLFERESRLGIARNYQTRTVHEGALYQTSHIRPHRSVAIALDIEGLPKDFPKQSLLRLGAEGRSASVEQTETKQQTLQIPKGIKDKFSLYLLTPLQRGDTPNEELLPSFKKIDPEKEGECTYWQGVINGVSLKLYGAITGKMQREGGWDMANHQPREVSNLIPAGSVFFCELVDTTNPQDTLNKLHLKQHGAMTNYGYGQFAVGIWKD
jgi:CRISPR-associated protein Cmr3